MVDEELLRRFGTNKSLKLMNKLVDKYLFISFIHETYVSVF